MANYFEKEYTVSQNHLNEYDDFSVCGILDFFQDIAGRHARELSLGFHDINAKGVNWILARTRFEIVSKWRYLSDIHMKTWPHRPDRFDIERDYQMISENGDILVKASSIWVLIDNKKKTLAPTSLIFDSSCSYFEEFNFPNKLKSLKFEENILKDKYTFVVSKSMLDHNHHMNNSRYGEVFENAINLDSFEKIIYFEINYVKESKLNEIVDFKYFRNDEEVIGAFYCCGELRAKVKATLKYCGSGCAL
ncbi:MAG: acyl-ACP thioesterase domain-containing protein [Bacilli bacterium]|jgi:acyl-ACP thioesterase